MFFVKKSLFLTFALAGSLLADEEKSYTYWDVHPLHVGFNSIFLGSSPVSKTSLGGDLVFNKASAFLYMLVPVNEKNFFIPRVDWATFTMDWNRNPKFTSTRFNFIQFALTYYTNSLDKWRWVLRTDCNMDTAHFGNSKYNLFSTLIWGAYNIWPDWHYHVGVYGYTGMEGAQIYPVIGFDYAWDQHWFFLCIFPIDYMLQYKWDEHWSLALKGRPLKERFRTNSSQPQPSSVFSYSTIGLELNLRYELFLRVEAEAFGGCNFGGNFYIKDRRGHNSLYTDLGISPYGGANLNYGF